MTSNCSKSSKSPEFNTTLHKFYDMICRIIFSKVVGGIFVFFVVHVLPIILLWRTIFKCDHLILIQYEKHAYVEQLKKSDFTPWNKSFVPYKLPLKSLFYIFAISYAEWLKVVFKNRSLSSLLKWWFVQLAFTCYKGTFEVDCTVWLTYFKE